MLFHVLVWLRRCNFGCNRVGAALHEATGTGDYLFPDLVAKFDNIDRTSVNNPDFSWVGGIDCVLVCMVMSVLYRSSLLSVMR